MATINRRPSGRWQAIVRHEGRSRSRTFTIRADAVKWARETERQAECGALHAPGARSATMTLGEVMTRYRDEVTPTKRCANKEWHAVNAFLRSTLAGVRMDRLSAAQLAAHRDMRLQSGSAPATVVRELGWLQHAIDIAIRDWGIPLRENVVKRVRRPRIDNRRERRLRLGEWERLIRAAHECGNALMPPLLVLALETGMRRGELLSMRWRDFDSGRRTVTLSQTKNGHPRTVPLTPLTFDSCVSNLVEILWRRSPSMWISA